MTPEAARDYVLNRDLTEIPSAFVALANTDLAGVLHIAWIRLNGALKLLQDAQEYIKRKGQVKPGWTDADHDAFWMLHKREEQLLTELGIEFYSLLTGPFSPENIA